MAVPIVRMLPDRHSFVRRRITQSTALRRGPGRDLSRLDRETAGRSDVRLQQFAAAWGWARGRRPDRRGGQPRGPSTRSGGCAGSASRAGRPGTGETGRTAPSRRRRGFGQRGCPRSAFMASIRSATWNATPSRVARARSATRCRPGQPEDRPAGGGLPVGCAQARQARGRRATRFPGPTPGRGG